MSSNSLFLFSFIVFFLYSLCSSAEFLKKELLISNSDNELKNFTVEVADNDILRSSEISIPNTKIVATFINGELVFNRRYN